MKTMIKFMMIALMSLAVSTMTSCKKEPAPEPTPTPTPTPTAGDTLYKFVMTEDPTANTYDALTDVKFGHTSTHTSATPVTVSEMSVPNGSGNYLDDVSTHLTSVPGDDAGKVFYSQTAISVPLQIFLFRTSDGGIITYGTVFPDGVISTPNINVCRITSGTSTNPVVTFYIQI